MTSYIVLKKGMYKHTSTSEEGEMIAYFRYRYKYNFATPFTQKHILAIHTGSETAVELRTLPDLQVYDEFNTVDDFYSLDGINRRRRRGSELQL